MSAGMMPKPKCPTLAGRSSLALVRSAREGAVRISWDGSSRLIPFGVDFGCGVELFDGCAFFSILWTDWPGILPGWPSTGFRITI